MPTLVPTSKGLHTFGSSLPHKTNCPENGEYKLSDFDLKLILLARQPHKETGEKCFHLCLILIFIEY